MASILEKKGKGDYPDEIPRIDGPRTAYGQVTRGIDRTTLTPQQKEEIISKFNALVEEKGADSVTKMIMDARKEQHQFDAKAQPERQKFIKGWFNRINDIPNNNPSFTMEEIEAWRNRQTSSTPVKENQDKGENQPNVSSTEVQPTAPSTTTQAIQPTTPPSSQTQTQPTTPPVTTQAATNGFDLSGIWNMIQGLISSIMQMFQPQQQSTQVSTTSSSPNNYAAPANRSSVELSYTSSPTPSVSVPQKTAERQRG